MNGGWWWFETQQATGILPKQNCHARISKNDKKRVLFLQTTKKLSSIDSPSCSHKKVEFHFRTVTRS